MGHENIDNHLLFHTILVQWCISQSKMPKIEMDIIPKYLKKEHTYKCRLHSKTCLHRISLRPMFVFRIDRCSFYAD